MLSAMSVPDLKGSQGTFSYYSSDGEEEGKFAGGIQIPVTVDHGTVRSFISGPDNPLLKDGEEMRIPLAAHIGKNGADAELVVNQKSYPLTLREYTPWIPLRFRTGLGMKTGFLVLDFHRQYSLKPCPCHRLTILGWTMTRWAGQALHSRDSQTQKILSRRRILGRVLIDR